MKLIRALKCKDGWYVKIVNTCVIRTKKDVRKFIRHEGLKIQDDEDKMIYAKE